MLLAPHRTGQGETPASPRPAWRKEKKGARGRATKAREKILKGLEGWTHHGRKPAGPLKWG